MDLIARNPYRILGVFANDTNKVQTANIGKIRAFLKVGKEVHFDIDAPNLLGSLNRTQEMLDNAISLLSDETEAAIQTLFWFHSDGAIKMMLFGKTQIEVEKTIKHLSYARLLNAAIISLANEEYASAAECYLIIIDSHFQEFRKAINFLPPPQGSTSDKQLVQLFIERLTAEYPDVDWWQHFSDSGKRSIPHYLKDIFEKIAINKIKENIDCANKEKPAKATEWLRVAQKLRRSCIPHIKVLQPCAEEAISKDGQVELNFTQNTQPHGGSTISAEGQLVLDGLCDELICECQRYYKAAKSDNEESVLPTLQLVDYALSLASSNDVREKATAFKKELDQDVQKLPPKEVKEEAQAIKKEIKAFCWKTDEIQWSIQLVKNCFPYLKAIKEKLGNDNAYYVDISTRIADDAMYNSVNELKRVESDYKVLLSKANRLKLVNTLRKAWELLLYFQQMHLSMEFSKRKLHAHVEAVQQKLKQYNVNYSDITISESLLSEEELLIKRGNYASLLQFCKQHPYSPYAEAARQKIREIEIDAFPKQITIKSILAYKAKYPNTHRDATVLKWIDYYLPKAGLWTADDYKLLLKLYPNHSERLKILDRIPDATAFEKCSTIEEYKKYLIDFPHGAYKQQASEEIEYLSCHTIQDLNRYIINNLHGKHCMDAMRRLEDLIYASVVKSGRYEEYFQKYPKGRYVADLRKREEEDKFYNHCKNRKDYEEYLRKYPNGRYVAAAKGFIEREKGETIGCFFVLFVFCVVAVIISAIYTCATDSHSDETDETQITAIEGEAFEPDDNISNEELECDDVESEEVENGEAHSLDKTTTTDLSLFDPGRRNSLVKTIPDVPMLLLPEEVEKWGKNHLSTGNTPYKSHYGEAHTGDNYLTFETKGDCDYVVIVKGASNDKYMNHIYIRCNDKATLYLPDGQYKVYFYSGKGWNPNKKRGSLTGGFVSMESAGEDSFVDFKTNRGWTYKLYPVSNGNLKLKEVSLEEIFEE